MREKHIWFLINTCNKLTEHSLGEILIFDSYIWKTITFQGIFQYHPLQWLTNHYLMMVQNSP